MPAPKMDTPKGAGRVVSTLTKALHSARAYPGSFLFALIFLMQTAGPMSRYAPEGFLDPWYYLSYFLDWREMLHRYAAVYYSSRVPYIAIGALFYHIFPPEAANILINVCFLWGACYAVYRLLSAFYADGPALLYSLAIATNLWLWQSLTWDYPDGPALVFILLGLWFCFAPPTWARGVLGAVIGGAFYACGGYTMLISGIAIAPALAAQAVFRRNSGIRAAALEMTAVAAGAAGLTGLCVILSRTMGGPYLFFYSQIGQALGTIHSKGFVDNWRAPVASWLPMAYQLVTPAIACLCAIACLAAGRRLKPRGLLTS